MRKTNAGFRKFYEVLVQYRGRFIGLNLHLQSMVYSDIVKLKTRVILRIFKTKPFSRFAKRERITDAMYEAVERAEKGILDADLGGNIIKQRVARQRQGRSKGYRVLIAVRIKKRYVFMHGFAKNEKSNIEDDELDVLKTYGAAWLNADEKIIKISLKEGKLEEINYESKN